MFVHYVVVKATVAVWLLFQSASFSCHLWSMLFFLHFQWWHLTEVLWSWPGRAETAEALLFVLSPCWELPLAVITVFKQIPFLKMTLYPLKITNLCWALQLSVQTGGTVLLSRLCCCSWLCHLSVGQAWNPNRHSMWEPHGCHHFSQPSGDIAKSFWFYKWQQRYGATTFQILKDI